MRHSGATMCSIMRQRSVPAIVLSSSIVGEVLGSHRYQIGFSGDANISYDALAFEPYFTATASNVGYWLLGTRPGRSHVFK